VKRKTWKVGPRNPQKKEATRQPIQIASHYDPGGAPLLQRRPLTDVQGKEEPARTDSCRMDRATQI